MIRVISLEIWKFCEGDRPRRQAWLDLAKMVQHATNRLWQVWELWHVENETPRLQREFLTAHAAWKRKEGEKPVAPVKATPPELSKKIYVALTADFPELNGRVRTLLQNKVQTGIGSRKATSGALPGWVAILLCHEGRPSFTRPLPIPFDKCNSKLLAPESDLGNWRLEVRLERNGETGASVVDRCELMTRKKKTGHLAATLAKIAAGTLTFKGSAVVFDRGKWFAQICYDDQVEKVEHELDSTRTAYLIPGRRCPWILRVPGKSLYRGGFGRHVTAFRQVLGRERRARQENYKWASSSSKGHGRKRACDPWVKLSQRWKDFQKRYNHEVTTQIVRELVERKIGTLVYFQPEGERGQTRFLARAGVEDNRLAGWEFFQIKTMLAYKCERVGIKFSVKKFGTTAETDLVSDRSVVAVR